jgi:hypothetical protein
MTAVMEAPRSVPLVRPVCGASMHFDVGDERGLIICGRGPHTDEGHVYLVSIPGGGTITISWTRAGATLKPHRLAGTSSHAVSLHGAHEETL